MLYTQINVMHGKLCMLLMVKTLSKRQTQASLSGSLYPCIFIKMSKCNVVAKWPAELMVFYYCI